MNRHHNVRLTAEAASPENAADVGFKCLDELRTFVRIACEWDASLGIPRPKRLPREKPADDRGSEP
jgi:hypothetical protein